MPSIGIFSKQLEKCVVIFKFLIHLFIYLQFDYKIMQYLKRVKEKQKKETKNKIYSHSSLQSVVLSRLLSRRFAHCELAG